MSLTEHLPDEVLEHIVVNLEPVDFPAFTATCRRHYQLLYASPGQFIWRYAFLERFDDPRKCITRIGEVLSTGYSYDWKGGLQERIRAQFIISEPAQCRQHELVHILRTLVSMIINTPPSSTAYETHEVSKNLLWLGSQSSVKDFIQYLSIRESTLTPEEQQLYNQLHTMFGFINNDLYAPQLIKSRGFMYDLRNHTERNDWGPYLPSRSGDSIMKVNWKHIRAIHHIMALHTSLLPHGGSSIFISIMPLSLPFCQALIPPSRPKNENDWAGVEGSWKCSFCFIDHRDLLAYNKDEVPDGEPRNTSIFDDTGFAEIFRSIDVEMQVTSISQNCSRPTRPTIAFSGDVGGMHTIEGTVEMTPDNEVRWRFTSGEDENRIWSSDGIQIGSVQSGYGVLGSWTTVFHDEGDPVGPFWLRKVHGQTNE